MNLVCFDYNCREAVCQCSGRIIVHSGWLLLKCPVCWSFQLFYDYLYFESGESCFGNTHFTINHNFKYLTCPMKYFFRVSKCHHNYGADRIGFQTKHQNSSFKYCFKNSTKLVLGLTLWAYCVCSCASSYSRAELH